MTMETHQAKKEMTVFLLQMTFLAQLKMQFEPGVKPSETELFNIIFDKLFNYNYWVNNTAKTFVKIE